MDHSTHALYRSNVKSLDLIGSGKVRESYCIDDQHMLIVATDRLSAFDVVLADPIPGKGAVLTTLSNFWFFRTQGMTANHLSPLRLHDVISDQDERRLLAGRSVVVQRLRPLPLEAIVRGYLAGSGWKEYQQTGSVCGVSLPAGLQQAKQLPEPVFTPSTKAAVGDHDENISLDRAVDLVGQKLIEQIKRISLDIYIASAHYALQHGIIIADTKFEFGLDRQDRLILMDELLTPDSSRFWPVESYRVGISPPSFDKQYIRDYLEALGWDKKSPGPRLPAGIIRQTEQKYRMAQQRLTGDKV